jgi:hypothetical protein
MPSAGLCVRFLLYLTLIIYCPEIFFIIFLKKVFRVTEYRFWYSIIGRSSEYPVNRVLVAIPNIYIYILRIKFFKDKNQYQERLGIYSLFSYNSLYLQVNPIVGHLNCLMYDWKRRQSLIKTPQKK